MNCIVRRMIKDDWDQVKFIYEAGIATGNSTFELQAPDYEKWISSTHTECSFVAENDSQVIGWCKASVVSDRCVYSGVGEVSVYVHPEFLGRGIGSILLGELILQSEQLGLWTLQAGIFPENTASLQMHMKHGFREIGRRERIGKLNGVWRDVILLERRSSKIQ